MIPITTKTAGGKVTGLLALTCVGTAALDIGDPVHLTDDYTVVIADGSLPVLGHVSVANVKRLGGAFPVDNPGGDVTVEARGFYVGTYVADGSITAGTLVGHGATSPKVKTVGTGVIEVGLALMTVANGELVDVLVR